MLPANLADSIFCEKLESLGETSEIIVEREKYLCEITVASDFCKMIEEVSVFLSAAIIFFDQLVHDRALEKCKLCGVRHAEFRRKSEKREVRSDNVEKEGVDRRDPSLRKLDELAREML